MSAAIVGIGATRFARRGRVSEAALAAQAITAALRDAGLQLEDVDGVVRFDREALWEFDLPGVLRLPALHWYGAVPFGPGSSPALVRLATLAIEQGLAQVVVGWHARHGAARATAAVASLAGAEQFALPFGLGGPTETAAVVLRRHMLRHGITAAQLASATRLQHAHAARNPRALVRRPLAAAAHVRSPLLAEPLRVADVAGPAVGGCAFVVTGLERARTVGSPPVRVLASVQVGLPAATRHLPDWWLRPRERTLRAAARTLFRAARRTPGDVDVACLWADPAPLALLGLEAWGLCPVGGGAAWLARRGRRLNPHGGQVGEAALDGINDLLEAVRQLRGEAANPVRGARLALVAGSPLEPTSAVLLGRG